MKKALFTLIIGLCYINAFGEVGITPAPARKQSLSTGENIEDAIDSKVSTSTAQIQYDKIANATTTLKAETDQEILDRITGDNNLANSTTTLQGNIDNEETARISADNDLADSTTTLQGNIDSEETARIATDNAISNSTATLQSNIDAEETARINADNTIAQSTASLQNQVDSLSQSTSSLAGIIYKLQEDTTTLQGNIDIEENARISADNNIADSTTTIAGDIATEISDRIAGDEALGKSTGTIRLDLSSETASRISADYDLANDTTTLGLNLDTLESNFEAHKIEIAQDTTTLRSDLSAEESARITQDNIIGQSTGTIRTDLTNETSARIGADNDISKATTTLRTDLSAESNARVAQDVLIGQSTETLRTDLTTETSARISTDNEIAQSTTSLRSDLTTETNNRIAGDNALEQSTGTLRSDLTNETNTRISADEDIAQATTTIQGNLDTHKTDVAISTTALENAKQDNLLYYLEDAYGVNISSDVFINAIRLYIYSIGRNSIWGEKGLDILASDADAYMGFYTGGENERMRIFSTGTVHIYEALEIGEGSREVHPTAFEELLHIRKDMNKEMDVMFSNQADGNKAATGLWLESGSARYVTGLVQCSRDTTSYGIDESSDTILYAMKVLHLLSENNGIKIYVEYTEVAEFTPEGLDLEDNDLVGVSTIRTNANQLTIASHTVVKGDFKFTGSLDSWCGIKVATDVATALDSNVWTSITGNWSECRLVDFTRNISTVTYSDSGSQWFLYNLSLEIEAPAGGGSIIDIGLSINGQEPTQYRTRSLSGTEQDEISIHSCIGLNENDTVNPVIREVDGDDVTVSQGNLIMWSR